MMAQERAQERTLSHDRPLSFRYDRLFFRSIFFFTFITLFFGLNFETLL